MTSVDLVVPLATTVILLLYVWRPVLAKWGNGACSTAQEWVGIGNDLENLIEENVDNRQLSPTTREALKLVVTKTPGQSRHRNVSAALDIVSGAHDERAKMFRTFASLAIMIGLCGTVVTFVVAFFPTIIGEALDATKLAKHLSVIYFVNVLAIGTSVVLYIKYQREHQDGEATTKAALLTLAQLPDDPKQDIDEQMQALTAEMAQQYRTVSREIVEGQTARLERLVGEVRTLGVGIRELVNGMVQDGAKESGAEMAAIRGVGAKVEALATQLDAGMRLIAQPFSQGIPALEGLKKAADSLSRIGDAFKPEELRKAIGELTVATAATQKAVHELPKSFADALMSASAQLQKGTREGSEAGVKAAMAGVQQTVAANLADYKTLLGGMEQRVAGVAASLVDVSAQLKTVGESNARLVQNMALVSSTMSQLASTLAGRFEALEKIQREQAEKQDRLQRELVQQLTMLGFSLRPRTIWRVTLDLLGLSRAA